MDSYSRRLTKLYLYYVAGFLCFLAMLAGAERAGMPPRWIGYSFLLATIVVYAAIGIASRTSDVVEYYVAGRRVPAVFNGMATAADWMSAASFIGMAGTLYFAGFDGLAFVMGWTGGYVLVALLLAPYLRRFGAFTIPDFLGARYEGNLPRFIGVAAVVLASFVYVVAQIYGVGLITSRFAGIQFEIGVFVGLAGVLVCSFMGGMRAVTWTQVTQYIVLIVAYLAPVFILSWHLTGVPLPQIMYGKVLQDLTKVEQRLSADAREIEVRALRVERAAEFEARAAALPGSLAQVRASHEARLDELRAQPSASAREIAAVQRQLREMPANTIDAHTQWSRARSEELAQARPPMPHAKPHAGATGKEAEDARNNFLALVFVLMVGTAGMPHILTRYYTTPGVAAARRSVFWSLFFILLLYLTAPAYAVFAKWEIYTQIVGSPIADLPAWVSSWGRIGLVKIEDINRDGVLQLAELTLNPDVILLALPEIAGLPYIVSGLVAAGGLAAALSTADGLLLTISSTLSHDVYFRMVNPQASTPRRLVVSKTSLLLVAFLAAWLASQRPDSIVFTVGFAFSIAAAGFFPALVLGIFWARANKWGAVCGMAGGLAMTLSYAVMTHPFFGGSMAHAWWGIQPIASGVFGVMAGFAITVVVSLATPKPSAEARSVVMFVRTPRNASQVAAEDAVSLEKRLTP
ncbi:cation acetate symporter [Niveibacterium sp. 24ML]|uniref:sodium:solute symporter family protein n=1 Tax=Niveibacterium sp. 24ML TaxID=2985512 RepID=UPI00226E0B42|nr:sodium:solute symporter family protein [Niveibacterium sp. 24ML]MCX9157170.1 cation acetate symporter [Niveibacterium sp. 24ML]